MDRPNLLFVFADQMRGQDMGCAGNPDVRTPHMDRLAREGMMFEEAVANVPVCTPCRGTMLTGLYPLSHRAVANDLPLSTDAPGLGTLTRAAGYRTGYVGKWHLDGVPRLRFTPPGPRRHGFDFWAVCNCSHRYFQAQYFRDTPEPVRIEGYEPVAQTDLAIAFLEQEDPRPFCLTLSWGPPHNPYRQAPDEYLALYDPAAVTLRPNVPPDCDSDRAAGELAGYYAHITALDAQLGRLLDVLDRTGQAANTIVVFTSDHGDMLWSHGRTRKQQPFEESVRVPFLIRRPGCIVEGVRSHALLSAVDFAPTLLSLMGIGTDSGMEGDDLSAVVRGEAQSGPDAVLLMDLVTVDEGRRSGLREWRGLRTATHTYARFADGEPWVLFDNVADPLQRHNLVDDPASRALRADLEAELGRRLHRLTDRCLPWDALIREMDLVAEWNARERELHADQGRFL